jgi:hypothetical protein
MTTTVEAVETVYAGCRFRSRLEARWAVAFDQFAIRWEYEPQGYQIDVAGRKRPYLPDFWLPDTSGGGIWCEVKGAQEMLDVSLLAHACRAEGGLPGDLAGRPVRLQQSHRLLILGPLPAESLHVLPLHCVFTLHQGMQAPGVYSTAAVFAGHEVLGTDMSSPVLDPSGCVYQSAWDLWPLIAGEVSLPVAMSYVYRTARMARFEHGETPEPPPVNRRAGRTDGDPVPLAGALRERLADLEANCGPEPSA